MIDEGNEGM